MEDDGKTAEGISLNLGEYTLNSIENTRRIKKIFDTQDCINRIYTDSDGNQVSLFVARSYDHKRLYHHPEVALSYGKTIDSLELQIIPNAGRTIPVHIMKNESISEVIAIYALLYDGGFIADPIRQQILNSLNLLVSARKKMTLFYVSGTALQNKSFAESNNLNILMLAIESFEKQKIENPVNN
ncbi:hypothetical protein [Desulfonema limicola]|nr:hypothetical protein [Desulfonema limicola]